MLTDRTKLIGIVIAVIIILIVLALLLPWGKSRIDDNESGSQMIDRTSPNINLNIQTPLEVIKINAKRPEPRTSFPYYKAYYASGDIDEKYFGDLDQVRYNLTTVEKAPDIARKAMEPYGGIPSDAYVSISRTNGGTIGPGTPEEKKYRTNNQVYFHKTIDGIPITGMSDGIIVWLGDNGELLGYKKFWRTLEPLGSVPVIQVDKAIQKLGNREIINPLQNPSDALVTQINLRYYAKSWNVKEIYLEPVWDFYAILPSGNSWEFFVYARQFAGFNQSPAMTTKTVAGKSAQEMDPFTATFTDTSDANPTKWLWDFGDGTTSKEKNPTHTYKTAGTYNVTLTVWNDLGSDTIEKQYTVNGAITTPVIANITATISATKITETSPAPPFANNETATQTISISPTVNATTIVTEEINQTAALTLPTTTTFVTNTTTGFNATNGS